MKNKIISIMLSLVMFVCIFAPAMNIYAKDFIADDIVKENYTEYNEYEMYKSISSKTDKELLEEGYSNKDIKYIRDFDYEAAVRERANLPEETLKLYGYNENEIKELKSFAVSKNIPEASLMSIARATLGSSIRTKKVGYVTENGKSVRYVDLQYTFQWKKVPFFILSDLVVIAFNSNNASAYSYKVVSGNNMKTNMTNLSTGAVTTNTYSWVFDTSSTKAVSAKFPVGIKDANGNLTHMCWTGIGLIRLTNPDTSSRLYIDACYGHTTINIVPSFSINISGVSAGVSLRSGMDARHDCGLYYSNFTIDDSYIYDGVVIGE